MAKPQDFFLTIFDFFAIMVPGVLFLGLVHLRFPGGEQLLGSMIGHNSVALFGIALCIAYVMGHFIFALGAHLDFLYDIYRRMAYKKQDRLFGVVKQAIKRVAEPDNVDVISEFKWCKSYLEMQCAEKIVAVERYESLSKLFRGLTVLFVLVALLFSVPGAQGNICSAEHLGGMGVICDPPGAVFLVLALISFLRFANQRRKRDDLCYMYFLHTVGRRSTPTRVSVSAS